MTILSLIINFFKLNFYKKHRIFVFVIMPVMVIVALFMIFDLGERSGNTVKAGVIMPDRDPVIAEAVEQLSSLQRYDFEEFAGTEDAVKEAVIGEEYSFIMVFPSNLSEKLLDGETPEIRLVTINQISALNAKLKLDSFLRLAAGIASSDGINTDELVNELKKHREFGYKIKHLEGDQGAAKGDSIIGFLLLFIFMQAMTATRLIMKDKESGTYNRIRTAPVSELSYTLANLISGYLMVTIQIALSIIVAYAILPMKMSVTPVQLFFLLSLFSFASLSIGLLLTGVSSSTESSGNLATVILTPASMLGGCFWPVSMMPEVMQKIAYITPQYWTINGLSLMNRSGSAATFNIMILVVMGVFFSSIYWLIIKNKNRRNIAF